MTLRNRLLIDLRQVRLSYVLGSIQKFGRALVAAIFLLAIILSAPAQSSPDLGVTLPDDKVGYQIQLVYVETSSAEGSNYDSTGQIATWVSQLQSWLRIKTGKELIFDTYQGKLDIAYLKFDENIEYKKDNEKELIQMYRNLNPATYFGKSLAFIVDQTRSVGSENCGWAENFSDYALIFPNLTYPDGGQCKSSGEFNELNSGLSFEAEALLHEIIHSYGVEHVCVDATDIMRGSPECEKGEILEDSTKPVTFDLTGSYYFGGNKSGVDIKTLKIWSDGSGQRRPELGQGICWKGEPCELSGVTFPMKTSVQLQIKNGKRWTVVHTSRGTIANCEGCLKFLYVNSYTFPKPGDFEYRIFKPGDKKFGAYTGPIKRIKVLN